MPRHRLALALLAPLLSCAVTANAGLLEGPAELTCPQLDTGGNLLPPERDDQLHITANDAELTEDGLSNFSGSVRLTQAGKLFETPTLDFDKKNRKVYVNAESLFRNRTLLIKSESAEFDLAANTGSFKDTEFTLVERGARGTADQITLARAGLAEVHEVTFTSCAPGSEQWLLVASEIDLDKPAGVGRARNARLWVGHIPILYAPWFRFPIDNRRRSGLLFPTLGDTRRTGLDIRVPLYLNLAPNYDAQLIPRFMSTRGTQIGAEGRYLFESATGRIGYEYLGHDQQLGIERSFLDVQHQQLLASRLSLDAKYGEVSDPAYFEDLGGRLEASSVTHLERSATFTYAAPSAYVATARVSEYQTVSSIAISEPTLIRQATDPYRRFPELRIEALTPGDLLDTKLGFDGEYVKFERGLPPEGQRLDLDPYVRLQRDETSWSIGSQFDWRYTRYRVTDPNALTALAASLGSTPIAPSAPEATRSLPEFSLDSGLRFDRLTDAGKLQTFEPKLFYLWVPYRNQDALPVFDSGEPEFNFVELFSRNRFSGEDRISDANHLAGTITSRLLDPTDGTVQFTASVGQIYRFEPERVTVNRPGFSDTAPDRGATDFIGALDYRLTEGWHAGTVAQWSLDTNNFNRTGVFLRYRAEERRVDLSYRYRRDQAGQPGIEQTDASFRTPVWGPMGVLARWRFSIRDGRTQEGLGGLEYQSCCLAVRVAVRRYQFSADLANPAETDLLLQQAIPHYTTGAYLQLELMGLAKLGAGGFKTLLPPLN